MIERFAKYLSEILHIPKPVIFMTNGENFPSDTMMAYYDVPQNTIYIKQSLEKPDQLFALAHEIRHIWQFREEKETFLNNYQTRETNNVSDYNLQIAEIDANAFAGYAMEQVFGLRPLFQGMDADTVQKIRARMKDKSVTKFFE